MHQTSPSFLRLAVRNPAALAALATMIAAPSLEAAVLTWDTSPGTVGVGNGVITGGAGTWDTLATLGNWTTDGGATNVAWVNNTPADSAIFSGTGGTISLATGITVNAITFESGGYSLTGNTLTLAGPTPTISVLEDATISSVLAGSNGLTKSGAGILTLSGANTYTGGTIVNGGVLVVSSDSNLGSTASSNPITLNGGTLSTGTGNVALHANHPINIGPAGGTLNGSVNNIINFSNLGEDKLIGSGTLTITGAGSTNSVLQIAGAQKLFSGDIRIESARINLLNSSATLGTGKVSIAAGTASLYASAPVNLSNEFTIRSAGGENRGAIRLSGGGTLSGNIILEDNATIHSDAGGTSTTNLTGNITGDFALGLGNGTAGNANNRYVLTGTNTHRGTAVLGVLNINADAALGVADGKLTLHENATLQAGAANLTLNAQREVELLGVGKFDANGGSITIAGPVTGFGSLEKINSGTLTLSGENLYTGSTRLAGGTLVLDYSTEDNSKLNDDAPLTLSGGTLRLVGGTHSEVVWETVLDGATTIISDGAAPIQLGFVTRNAGGTLALSASGIATSDLPNDSTGIIGAWATIGGSDWAMSDENGAIVAYDGYTDVPLGGTIANGPTANIRLTGGTTGNVLLGAPVTNINTLLHDQTPATVIDTAGNTLRLAKLGGILIPAETGALTIGTAANSGTLTAGGTNDEPGELVITTQSANPFTVNSVIADNGTGQVSLEKGGTGTLVLGGTNTFTGQIKITGGTLEVGGAGSLGVAYGGAILNNGALVYSSSAGSALEGVISGSGSLTKSGTGTLTLDGENTYAGGTTLAGGILELGSAGALGTGALTITGGALDNSSGAALTNSRNNAQNWNGDFRFAGTNDLNLGTGAVAMNASRTVDIEAGRLSVGGIAGIGFSLTKEGDGTLVINGNSSYTGGTNVNAGTLEVSTTGALSNAAPVAITEEGTVKLNSDLSNTFNHVFTGDGRIVLNNIGGSGDTRLTGDNSNFNGVLQLTGNGGNKLNAQNLKLGAEAVIRIDQGGQIFTNGTLIPNAIEMIGTGNTENRGAIRLNNSTLTGPITLLGDATIGGENGTATGTITGTAAEGQTQTLTLGTVNSTGGGTFSGVIGDGADGGKLAVTIFSGTNTLSGANTYSGATTVSGTATLNLTGSAANSALTMSGGTNLRGEGTVASLTTGGALSFTIDPSTTGAFASTGAATLGGTVNVILNGAAIPLTPVTVMNFGSTTATTADFVMANSGNYRAPVFTVGEESVTLALGNTNLTWTGTGGSQWNVNNTANWEDASSTPQKFFFGDVVTFNDEPGADQNITLANSVQPGAMVVDNSEIAYTITGEGTNVIAAGSLVKRGSEVLTLSGPANTFAGGTVIEEGTIAIQHSGSLGTGAIAIEAGATLAAEAGGLTLSNPIVLAGGTIDSSSQVATNSLTFNGIISGDGGVTIIGTGDQTATGGGQVGAGVRFTNAGNSFTGDIRVLAGLFSYESNAALGNAANKIILDGGGLLDLSNSAIELTHDVEVLENGGLFRTYTGSTATLSGALLGSGDFRHTDGGRLILAGDLSGFTGVYDNQAGTTIITSQQPLGGSWSISAGTLEYRVDGAQTWEDPLSGTGNLVVSAGTLTLAGDNFYNGTTNVAGGTLVLNGSIEGSSGVNVTSGKLQLGGAEKLGDFVTLTLGGGTFDTAGFSESLGALDLNANSTLDFGNGASVLSFSMGSFFEPDTTLSILNWSGSTLGGGTDQLIFAEDMSGWLTHFNFAGVPAAQIDHGNGAFEIVAVPEPSSLALVATAVGLLGFRRRTRRQS